MRSSTTCGASSSGGSLPTGATRRFGRASTAFSRWATPRPSRARSPLAASVRCSATCRGKRAAPSYALYTWGARSAAGWPPTPTLTLSLSRQQHAHAHVHVGCARTPRPFACAPRACFRPTSRHATRAQVHARHRPRASSRAALPRRALMAHALPAQPGCVEITRAPFGFLWIPSDSFGDPSHSFGFFGHPSQARHGCPPPP